MKGENDLIKAKTEKSELNLKSLLGDFLLLLSAMIWGMAYVARRIGSLEAPPFTFNGLRFLIGSSVLIPLLLAKGMKSHLRSKEILAGIITGFCLSLGTNLQQIGLKWTDAGRAGFITGLYVVLVPFFGLFLKRKVSLLNAFGALLALLGLFFLNPLKGGSLNPGDFFMLLCAMIYAIYILVVGKFSPELNPLGFSFVTFLTCGILSLIPGVFESPQWGTLRGVFIPLLYSGLFAVGIAYSLQVFAQKFTLPNHAAIIMSLEAVFAAIFGGLILKESLSFQEIIGCFLMFLGFIVVQGDKLLRSQN
ncbi:MAG: DMT family transporter [Caldiserica bacterium]|nr:DMT family transporter [Caldisericota bacterium]